MSVSDIEVTLMEDHIVFDFYGLSIKIRLYKEMTKSLSCRKSRGPNYIYSIAFKDMYITYEDTGIINNLVIKYLCYDEENDSTHEYVSLDTSHNNSKCMVEFFEIIKLLHNDPSLFDSLFYMSTVYNLKFTLPQFIEKINTFKR